MPQIKTDAPLEGVILFSTSAIKLWSGRAKLTPEDLGNAADDMPPAAIASLGSKQLFPKDQLKALEKVKREMNRVLSAVGTRFLGGWAIAVEDADAVVRELNELVAKGNALADDMFVNFTKILNDWWAENPHWKHILAAGTPERSSVRSRIMFDWNAYMVSSPTNTVIAGKLAGSVSGMGANLFAEVVDEAKDFVKKSLKADRNAGTQKTIKPLQRLAAKLRRLGFLDHHAHPVADVCETILAGIPSVGKITDGDYLKLIRVAYLLADLDGMRTVARRVLDGELATSLAIEIGGGAGSADTVLLSGAASDRFSEAEDIAVHEAPTSASSAISADSLFGPDLAAPQVPPKPMPVARATVGQAQPVQRAVNVQVRRAPEVPLSDAPTPPVVVAAQINARQEVVVLDF